jgi:hypothetical protein
MIVSYSVSLDSKNIIGLATQVARRVQNLSWIKYVLLNISSFAEITEFGMDSFID